MVFTPGIKWGSGHLFYILNLPVVYLTVNKPWHIGQGSKAVCANVELYIFITSIITLAPGRIAFLCFPG